MRVVVTCGPSYEPIDEVRRLTNFSTGRLGQELSARLLAEGHEVTCFRGVCASSQLQLSGGTLRAFSTNDDLLGQLRTLEEPAELGAFLHVAALCDFRVASAEVDGPGVSGGGKICSRSGGLVLRLVPAQKVIRELRSLFPNARIVGWKYEVEGGREGAIAKGGRQILENATDACVVNGPAYGPGFGWLRRGQRTEHQPDAQELAGTLVGWLGESRRV
jgi:phosphopantothenoylcysteine synthetase/decarboxylase